jgi:hypothetical protein
MLFRYDVPGAAKGSHRWLRQKVDMAIYPSLKLTATVMASYWAKTEHIVSVEIANHRSEEIFLDKLSVASREYRLEQIGGQVSSSDDVVALDVHERVTLHYRLVPLNSSSSPSSSNACMMSECKMTGGVDRTSRQECVTSHEIDFLCLGKRTSSVPNSVEEVQTRSSQFWR